MAASASILVLDGTICIAREDANAHSLLAALCFDRCSNSMGSPICSVMGWSRSGSSICSASHVTAGSMPTLWVLCRALEALRCEKPWPERARQPCWAYIRQAGRSSLRGAEDLCSSLPWPRAAQGRTVQPSPFLEFAVLGAVSANLISAKFCVTEGTSLQEVSAACASRCFGVLPGGAVKLTILCRTSFVDSNSNLNVNLNDRNPI